MSLPEPFSRDGTRDVSGTPNDGRSETGDAKARRNAPVRDASDYHQNPGQNGLTPPRASPSAGERPA